VSSNCDRRQGVVPSGNFFLLLAQYLSRGDCGDRLRLSASSLASPSSPARPGGCLQRPPPPSAGCTCWTWRSAGTTGATGPAGSRNSVDKLTALGMRRQSKARGTNHERLRHHLTLLFRRTPALWPFAERFEPDGIGRSTSQIRYIRLTGYTSRRPARREMRRRR